MNSYRYVTPARLELRDAALYYRERSSRVAASFMGSVQHAVDRLLEFPESAPVLKENVRGMAIARFPYTLVYRIEGDLILILAVAHQKQRPYYWVDRAL